MKVAIFGGTGSAGRMLVEKALARGLDVVAYARNPHKLPLDHVRLRVVQGELHDGAGIESAVQGSVAVISLLGPAFSSGKTVALPIAAGTENIVRAMQKFAVRRLIATSTNSSVDANDRFDVRFKLAVALIKLTQRAAYNDIVASANIVRGCDREWTLVRLPLLSSGPKSAQPHIGYVGVDGVRLMLSRETLTDFLFAQLFDSEYMRKAPAISD